jgi:protein-disulfide isomerase
MSKNKGTTSKRQAVREKRRQQQRKQRLLVLAIITGIALLVALALIIPSILEARTPVGEITQITPGTWPMADGRALGDPNAPVKIDVYEDFQCPRCGDYTREIEPRVIESYVATGQVYYVFRHFPFIDDQAPGNESDQAAKASMCAAEQDRFWDYHEIVFANWSGENQGAFSDKRLVAFAEALGLDMDAFNACFESDRFEDEIEADLAAGRRASVQGTPSVLVNGQIVTPGFVPSYEEISAAVEAALSSQ